MLLLDAVEFIGLTPLMLNKSVGAQFLVPVAISLAFGVFFAMVVTLLVVPAGYLVFERGDSGQSASDATSENIDLSLELIALNRPIDVS